MTISSIWAQKGKKKKEERERWSEKASKGNSTCVTETIMEKGHTSFPIRILFYLKRNEGYRGRGVARAATWEFRNAKTPISEETKGGERRRRTKGGHCAREEEEEKKKEIDNREIRTVYFIYFVQNRLSAPFLSAASSSMFPNKQANSIKASACANCQMTHLKCQSTIVSHSFL